MSAMLPLVYACSGCSSAAQMTNHLKLDRDGVAPGLPERAIANVCRPPQTAVDPGQGAPVSSPAMMLAAMTYPDPPAAHRAGAAWASPFPSTEKRFR